MNEKVVERSIVIDAPRARVWQAITDPEELAQWFLPPSLGARMKRDHNDKIYVCMGPMEVPVAVFEEIDPSQQVTIRGLPDRLLAATYTLIDDKDGTRVMVTMTGFESLPEDAGQERLGPSGLAWEKGLANLKAYVDGVELPFPEGYVAALFGHRREAQEKFVVERSIWIDASRERVWRAITDPKQIQQWFSPEIPWRLSALEVGGRLSVYDLATDADTHVYIIDVVEPLRQFVTRTSPETYETTYVTAMTLAEENGGVCLTVTYTAYESEADDDLRQHMEQSAFGFGMMLENLQAVIEGESLPYPGGF